MSDENEMPPESWVADNFPKRKNATMIGNMQVHPAAEVFPALYQNKDDPRWKEFVEDIRVNGQLQPITVYQTVIIDGRNRVAALNELNRHPLIVDFRDIWRRNKDITVYDYIRSANLQRRDMTPDQKVQVLAKIQEMEIETKNKAAKESSEFKPGSDPRRNPGGKAVVNTKRGSPQKRDTKTMHERSTVGQLAKLANVSRRKAAQAVSLIKAEAKGEIPAGTTQSVITGTVSLSKALAPLRKPPTVQPFESRLKSKLLSLVRSFSKEKPKEDVVAMIIEILT